MKKILNLTSSVISISPSYPLDFLVTPHPEYQKLSLAGKFSLPILFGGGRPAAWRLPELSDRPCYTSAEIFPSDWLLCAAANILF